MAGNGDGGCRACEPPVSPCWLPRRPPGCRRCLTLCHAGVPEASAAQQRSSPASAGTLQMRDCMKVSRRDAAAGRSRPVIWRRSYV